MAHRRYLKHMTGMLLSITVFLVVIKIWDIDFLGKIKNLNKEVLILGIFIYWIFLFVRAVRLSLLLPEKYNIGFNYILYSQILSNLVGQFTIAKSGEAIKILLIRKKIKIGLKEMSKLFISEKSIDFLLFLSFMFISILFTGKRVFGLFPNGLYLVSFVILLICVLYVYFYMKNRSFNKRRMIIISIVSLIGILMLFGVFFVSFYSTVTLDFLPIFVIFSISSAIGILSLLPGGTGSREFSAMAISTKIFGYSPDLTMFALIHVLVIIYLGNISAYVTHIILSRIFNASSKRISNSL